MANILVFVKFDCYRYSVKLKVEKNYSHKHTHLSICDRRNGFKVFRDLI